MSAEAMDFSDSFGWLFCYGPPKSKKAEEKKVKLEKVQCAKPLGNKPQDSKEKPDKPGANRATEADLKDVIHVVGVDLNIEENTEKHHTDKYECTQQQEPELVVRRGQSFRLLVSFDREYNIENDDLKFVFKTGGQNFKRSDATYGNFMLDESGKATTNPKEWSAKLIKRDGKTLHVEVHTPCDCAIGDFSFNVVTHTKIKNKKIKKLQYEHPDDITVLFNPWCEDDETYYPNVKELEEYVLNDHGCIYRGSGYMPKAKDWNFGQFEDGILEASLFLAQKCFKKKTMYRMADPVLVSRKIAAVVNCNDADNGVLWGDWSGQYEGEGCCSPLDWYGSVRILRQYMEKLEPVRYGQCWVFSGVVTTVCRALGIPARSVTNFGSAHDTDQSCTIDKYYKNVDGALVPDSSSDSIWNYHVWNEVWMKRNDINCSEEEREMFNGWQAIDATPQEESGGMMTCGPCPVRAVKEGMVKIPYDCAFIFSEVNADEVHWEITPEGDRPFKIKPDKIGRSISTKKADGKPYDRDAWFDRSRYDVTDCYKYAEGSKDNRQAVARAALGAKKAKDAYGDFIEIKDVKFKLLHDSDLLLGKQVKVKLTAENKSRDNRVLSLVMFRFLTQPYNSDAKGLPFKIFNKARNEEIVPNKVYEYEVVLEPEDYLQHIDDGRGMSIQAFASVEATQNCPHQKCTKAHNVEFGPPDVEVQMPSSVKKGEEFDAIVRFNNPLKDELTHCKAGYEGRGFEHVTGVQQPNVPGEGVFEGKFKLKAIKKGNFTLTFKFTSRQLKHLSGSALVKVE